MRKKVVVLLILGLFLVPSIASARGQGKGKHKAREFNQQLKTKRKAHGEQQRSENKAFRETIKDMDVDQRAVAIKGHRQTQHQGNVDFHESMHAERAERLKERFNNNDKLTDEEEAQILADIESRHEEKKARNKKRYQETEEYVEGIWNNESMSKEDKQVAVEAYREERKAEKKAYFEQRKEERKKKREEIREKRKERRQDEKEESEE